jgi:hypothetical protein
MPRDEYSVLEEHCKQVKIAGQYLVYGDPEQLLAMIAEIRRLREILDNVRSVERIHAEEEYKLSLKSCGIL